MKSQVKHPLQNMRNVDVIFENQDHLGTPWWADKYNLPEILFSMIHASIAGDGKFQVPYSKSQEIYLLVGRTRCEHRNGAKFLNRFIIV
jgi:hypothetical protein